MGNRLNRAAAACLFLGLLVALVCLLGSVGAGFGGGNFGPRQAVAAEGASKAQGAVDSATHQEPADDDEEETFLDPMGPNAACYVCHMTFIHEELAKVHLAEKVTCIDCHGVSAGHANDEDIGATKPDKTYKRCQISPSCRKCHEEHVARPEKVIAKWIKIGAPKREPVCTDCHGTHRIERPELEEPTQPDEPAEADNVTNASQGKTEK